VLQLVRKYVGREKKSWVSQGKEQSIDRVVLYFIPFHFISFDLIQYYRNNEMKCNPILSIHQDCFGGKSSGK